jgi:hypothetical protein
MRETTDKSSSCLVCTLYLEYNLLQKLLPVQGYCNHAKLNYSPKPVFRISKWCLCCALIFLAVFAVPLISYLFLLPVTCPKDQCLCLIYLADFFFSLGTVILVSTHLIKIKSYEYECNAWLFLFENSHLYNVDDIFPEDEKKKMRVRRYFTFALFGIVGAVMGFFVFRFPYDDLSLNLLRKWSLVHYFILQCFGNIETTQRIKMIEIILKALEKALQKTMTRRLFGGTNDFDISFDLKQYRNLITVTNLNFGLLMKYFMTIRFTYTLASIICLIFNIYILIKYLDYNAILLGALQLRTASTIVGILYVAFDVEMNINSKVSPNCKLFLSAFLYNY